MENVIEVFQDVQVDMLYTWQMSPTLGMCHNPRDFAIICHLYDAFYGIIFV